MALLDRFETNGALLDALEWTPDEMFAFLERSGMNPNRSQVRRSKRPLRKWEGAFSSLAIPDVPSGLASEPLAGGEPSPASGDAGRDGELPPTPPSGARLAPLPVSLSQLAEERIAHAYGFIGGGVGMATGNPMIPRVVDEYSPAIARAWVKAAEENEFARRVVSMMSAGGATGELVMAHLVMVGGILYVSGRAPALSGIYGHKFGPPPVVASPPSGSAGGDGDDGSGDAVGEPAGTPTA